MGQLMDKFHGQQWRDKQIRKITDKVYDRFKQQQTGSGGLTFEDIYIAVLLVYNDMNKYLPGPHFDPPSDMNKYLPGPHFDPPSRAEVKATMDEFDINLDGELNHEEFVKFIQQLTTDTCVIVSQKLLITLVVAPTVAMATKRATEGVPGVGKVVQKLPTSIFASLVTLAIVLFQQSGEGI